MRQGNPHARKRVGKFLATLFVFFLPASLSASPEPSHLAPTLVVDGRDFGVVQVFPQGPQEDLAIAQHALHPLWQALSQHSYERVVGDPQQPSITLKELQFRGSQVKYNPLQYQLDITLPPEVSGEFQSKTQLPRRKVPAKPTTATSAESTRAALAARNDGTPLGRALARIMDFAAPEVLAQAVSSAGRSPSAASTKPASTSQPGRNQGNVAPPPLVFQGIAADTSVGRALLDELRGMRSLLAQMAENTGGKDADSPNLQFSAQPSSPEQGAGVVENRRNDSLAWAEKERELIEKQFQGASREELFAKIFGSAQPARARNIAVEISIDGSSAGIGQLHYSEDFSTFSVGSPELVRILRRQLLPLFLDTLGIVDQTVRSEELKKIGIGYEVRDESFQLSLSIPIELRKEQRYDLRWQERNSDQEVVKPAIVSGFLNLGVRQDWLYQEVFFDDDTLKKIYLDYFDGEEIERQSLGLDFDGALNAMGWVVEGQGRYSEPRTRHSSDGSSIWDGFRREEIRLVKDFDGSKSRFQAGDISSGGGVGGVTSLPLLGGRWDLNYSRSRNRRRPDDYTSDNRDEAQMQFLLTRPGDANITVNGRTIKRMRLEAGPHALSGFTGGQGDNQVEVRVTYDNGEIEVIPYMFYQERQGILEKGLRNYTMVGGVLRHGTPTGMAYSPNVDSAMVGFGVEQGLAEGWVAGVRADLSNTRILGAADLSTPYNHRGSLTFNAVLSAAADSGYEGHMLGVQASKPMVLSSRFTGGMQYNSRFYSSQLLGNASQQVQLVRVMTFLGVSIPIWKGSASTRLETRFNRNPGIVSSSKTPYAPVDYSFQASAAVSPKRGLSINASSRVSVQAKEYNPQFNLFVTWFFSMNQNNFHLTNQWINRKQYRPPEVRITKVPLNMDSTLTRDSISFKSGYYEREWNSSSAARWSYSHGAGLNDGYSLGAGGNYQTDQLGFSASGAYTHNNFQGMVNYALSDYSRTLQLSRNHYLSTRFETTFLFADGLWTLGRPVRNGFVLVKGQNELSNTVLRINPVENYGSEVGASGRFLAGAYGHLGEYQNTSFRLVPVNPPMGSWTGREYYQVLGEYKRGFALRVGELPTVLARATLIDEAGEPVKRTTFSVVDKSEPGMVLLESFTTVQGVMQAGNLKPGRTYLVKFPADSFIEDLELEIPRSARGILNLGTLKVQHQRMSKGNGAAAGR